MKTFIGLLLFLLLNAASCQELKLPDGVVKNEAAATTLRKSPINLTVDDQTYFASAELWRNFMPMIGKKQNELHCVSLLTERDSLEIPATLKIKRQYVLKGDSIWTYSITETTRPQDYQLQVSTTSGPAWPPESKVDIILEFETLGNTYHIQKKSAAIGATY